MVRPHTAVPRNTFWFVVLGSGLSSAMGFAGVGLALYASGPALLASGLFAAVGAAFGAGLAVLRYRVEGAPAPRAEPMPAEDLARLVRSTLAAAQQERQAGRSGSAADRRPDERLPTPPPSAMPASAPAPAPIRQPADNAVTA